MVINHVHCLLIGRRRRRTKAAGGVRDEGMDRPLRPTHEPCPEQVQHGLPTRRPGQPTGLLVGCLRRIPLHVEQLADHDGLPVVKLEGSFEPVHLGPDAVRQRQRARQSACAGEVDQPLELEENPLGGRPREAGGLRCAALGLVRVSQLMVGPGELHQHPGMVGRRLEPALDTEAPLEP